MVSPYEPLKEYILGQQDFVKKQMDIIQFTLKYTREAYESENKYWLYLKKQTLNYYQNFYQIWPNVYSKWRL